MSHLRFVCGASAGALFCALNCENALAQQSLPTIDVGSARPKPGPVRVAAPPRAPRLASVAAASGFSPEKKQLPIYREPTGQTFTSIDAQIFKHTPLTSVTEVLQYSPGLSFKQGNGPRDIVVSIRGSSARNGFGVRNIQLLEDGFSVTQPDGLSRTDLTDPHAYAGFDVYRGPSSALFGDFANGGAINFRTRTGAEIDGVETGHEFGSYGFINNYTAIGKKVGDFDIALFASDVRADGWTQHSDYNTQTLKLTARYQATPNDLFTFKAIHNELFGDLSQRLSLNQYYLNPYQRGCQLVPTTTGLANSFSRAWCGQISVPKNGVTGATTQSTSDMAGSHRNDRRDVFGLRWEHDFDINTKWRTQALYDDKNIIQPAGATSALQDEPAVNATTDITQRWSFGGHDATHFAGLYFNRTRYASYTGNVLPIGDGAYGATTNKQNATMQNLGGRAREEVALSKGVTLAVGLAAEMTKIAAQSQGYAYTAAARPTGVAPINANHSYWNFGPEASVSWRALPELLTHVRASSGYGTPNPGQLFVNAQGVNGDNSTLKTQRNTGFDAGFDWTPHETLRMSLTGFCEWCQDEKLSQSPGRRPAELHVQRAGLRASRRRGADRLATAGGLARDRQLHLQQSYFHRFHGAARHCESGRQDRLFQPRRLSHSRRCAA
jgi:iron complex outermembrane receptor protein